MRISSKAAKLVFDYDAIKLEPLRFTIIRMIYIVANEQYCEPFGDYFIRLHCRGLIGDLSRANKVQRVPEWLLRAR